MNALSRLIRGLSEEFANTYREPGFLPKFVVVGSLILIANGLFGTVILCMIIGTFIGSLAS